MAKITKKTSALTLLGCSMLVACQQPAPPPEDPYLVHCRALLEELLVAPSTLNVVSSEHYQVGGEETVRMEYDAENRMGAPLRKKIFCTYAKESWKDAGVVLQPGETPQPEYLDVKKIVMSDGILQGNDLAAPKLNVTLKLINKSRASRGQ